jgi:hypothetical protein
LNFDITFIDVKPFDYAAWEKLAGNRPKPLEMNQYGSVISDAEFDALHASWGCDPEPEPDETEYASFIVNTCQGVSQNKTAERLAEEFGGSKAKYRQLFNRKQLPVTKVGSAWCFTDDYKWKTSEL